MAKRKTKPPAKAVKKPAPRTVAEKLRGLVNLKIESAHLYTQKELSAILGISERTIRRFKNQKGYALSAATIARINKAVTREDNQLKRELEKGTAFKVITETVKGKKRRRIIRTKDKSLKMPPSRILQMPIVYTSKSGASHTIKISVEGWSTAQKIEYLESAHASKRFTAWTARVMVPPGVGRSGRKGEETNVNDEEDIDEETGEVKPPEPVYYMIGPFDLTRNRAKIRSEINYHEDAGRVIVDISLVEKEK